MVAGSPTKGPASGVRTGKHWSLEAFQLLINFMCPFFAQSLAGQSDTRYFSISVNLQLVNNLTCNCQPFTVNGETGKPVIKVEKQRPAAAISRPTPPLLVFGAPQDSTGPS